MVVCSNFVVVVVSSRVAFYRRGYGKLIWNYDKSSINYANNQSMKKILPRKKRSCPSRWINGGRWIGSYSKSKKKWMSCLKKMESKCMEYGRMHLILTSNIRHFPKILWDLFVSVLSNLGLQKLKCVFVV